MIDIAHKLATADPGLAVGTGVNICHKRHLGRMTGAGRKLNVADAGAGDTSESSSSVPPFESNRSSSPNVVGSAGSSCGTHAAVSLPPSFSPTNYFTQ